MIPEAGNERSILAEFPEMNPGPVCRLDLSGKVILANAAARKLFGDHELRGNVWQTLCPGLSGLLWSRITTSTEPVQHEVDFGDRCVLFTHVRSSSEATVFVFGSDVTELRKTELKLAEVARFPEMNPGPVLKTDLQGFVLLANASAQRLLGGNVIGRSWLDICPGITAALWKAIRVTPEPVPLEAQLNGCIFVFTHRCDPVSKLVFVFGADITRQKLTENALRQSEKMATLGTLAAGIAHELNNPAAATRRAADHLVNAVERLDGAVRALNTGEFSPEAHKAIQVLEDRVRDVAPQLEELDPLARADREVLIEEWLDKHAIPQAEVIAHDLVAMGLTEAELSRYASVFTGTSLVAVLGWVSAAFQVYGLMNVVSRGSERISEIVEAMKGYSYVGQAPVRMVNIHSGLDNTLVILHSKLKAGINVRKEYQPDIPEIIACGGELNQVWTNLLDNAADAMNGKGEITIRTKKEDKWVIVEIADNGPGIPESLQSRIFDPFFTTKEPGKGTGLGLATAYSIVCDMHKGAVSVVSKPGKTVFTVKLPVDNPDLQLDQRYDQSAAEVGAQ